MWAEGPRALCVPALALMHAQNSSDFKWGRDAATLAWQAEMARSNCCRNRPGCWLYYMTAAANLYCLPGFVSWYKPRVTQCQLR